MKEVEVGKVVNYFDKISVAAIEMTKGKIVVGDTIHIKGNTTDCTLAVESMQIEHESVKKAKKGDSIGLKVSERVRGHDKVYVVKE